MAFTKGQPKPLNSGRKLGVKNKKRIIKAADVLASKDINPVEEMLKLMPELSPRDQIETWKFLLSYIEAKPKDSSIEDENSNQELNVEDLKEVNPEELLKIAKSKN